MLELRTFGGVHVIRSDGERLGGAAAQRRSLALLSFLAVHGDAGVRRDRILAMLWPDGDPEKSRHALTQSLYHIRRALDCDDLFVTAGSDVRLNTARITTDVAQFTAAVDESDHPQVIALYRGTFMDGFVLPGAAEFDQWLYSQRARYQNMVSRALAKTAESAEARRDWPAAIDAHKKLVALDPLSATATMKLMRALWASGDRPGAIQQGRVHCALIKQELEIEPDGAVLRLIDELSDKRDTPSGIKLEAPVEANGAAMMTSGEIAALERASDEALTAPSNARHNEGTAAPKRRRYALPALFAAAAAVVLAVGAIAMSRATGSASMAASAAQPVVVAPFRVAGADPSLAYLREGMVELLSARLADDSVTPAIDPGRVIGAWRKAHLTGAADTPHPEAIRIAKDLGGRRVVVGGIVGNAANLVLSASLLGVSNGEARAQASVEGPVDSLTTLVDRLAAKLLASSAGEGDRFSDRVTPSLPALRDFLEGQAAYRSGDYAQAVPAYERALSRDSTFALAALHLALAADWLNDAEQHDRALAIAWANRKDLSERDAAHLIAFAGPRYPAPSLESEQVAAWERAVAVAPDRADVWYELGERLFRAGGVAGMMNAHVRAKAVLTRALELDPEHLRARRLLIMLAARTGDTALLAKIASPEVLRDSVGDFSGFLQWRVALVRGDSSGTRRARASMAQMNDASLRALAMSSVEDAVGVDDGERAAKLTLRRNEKTDGWFDAMMEQHSMALNEGMPKRALEVTRQIEERDPSSRAHLRLRVLDALYSVGDRSAAQIAADSLAATADAAPARDADARALQAADACVLEQWRLSNGSTSTAKKAIAMLQTAEPSRQAVPVSANPRACAAIVQALYSVATHEKDAASHVAALDSLMLVGPAVSDASSYANIVVGRLYRGLGNPRAALVAYRRRTYMTGWSRYVSTARREEAELASSIGETEIARNSFRRYLALHRSPEPSVAADVEKVRGEAAALEASVKNK